jgi:nitrate/TMAO reductase-like tetraheme cytochrome c subunit
MKKLLFIKRVLILIGVLIIVLGGLGLVNVVRNAYTGPLHCQSCHSEQTELWQSSGPHSIETQCSDCHAPWPRIVPTRTNVFKHYRDAIMPTDMIASDERITENCLQCHESVLDRSHTTSEIVVLSHRVHLEEDMMCVDCHRNISHDEMVAQTYRPPKRVCYECHLRDIDVGSQQDQSCMNCHRIILSRQEVQEVFEQKP